MDETNKQAEDYKQTEAYKRYAQMCEALGIKFEWEPLAEGFKREYPEQN